MDILTALNESQELITLSRDYEKEELKLLRETNHFYCPQCKSKVRLKIGAIYIPHFAHISNTLCSNTFSERETQEHLAGKQQLYHFFKDKQLQVKMEAFIPQIRQRPDILLSTKNDRHAIEFQCSTIPLEIIQERNKGYKNANISPIWIVHTPEKLKKHENGVYEVSLSKFLQQFIQQHPQYGTTLLTYNPQKEQFHYFSHLLYLNGNQYIAKVRTLTHVVQQFPFLHMKAPTKNEFHHYWSIFRSKRNLYLKNRVLMSKKGLGDFLLKNCYNHRILPHQLPSWIGIPTKGAQAFGEIAVEWQACLLFYLLNNHHLNNIEKQTTLFVSKRPTVSNYEDAIKAALNYIELLDRIGINVAKGSFHFEKSVENLFSAIYAHFLAKPYEN